MWSLEGKVAVITGATSGIGARTAELFVARGAAARADITLLRKTFQENRATTFDAPRVSSPSIAIATVRSAAA